MNAGIEKMMAEVGEKESGKLSKQELEGNIQAGQNWVQAIKSGTFPGHSALHITMLINFLEMQTKIHLDDYMKRFPKIEPEPKPDPKP